MRLDFYLPNVGKKTKLLHWELAAQVYRQWDGEGRGPVMKLPSDIVARGWSVLAYAGVRRDTWFVGLHVREAGYQPLHRTLHNALNAEVGDYIPAIEEVTSRGGWVIRMGDRTMKPMTPMKNVIDYCHSDIKADWMDIFLASQCRFFIGTSSGLGYVPQIYGVPCVLTNWWPPAQRPWHAQDIFVPKLYRRKVEGNYLTLAESLAEPLGYCNSLSYLEKTQGVVVESNTPMDIRNAVAEMFDRIDGSAVYDAEDLELRDRAERIYSKVAKELYGSDAAFGAASMARDFLKRHKFLLEESAQREIESSRPPQIGNTPEQEVA
jgi:putative glycosyltransferase (TIGR04372 family)